MNGLIIDSFAGGGGASTGIERALGRSPDIAINHDREALAMHAANHPVTRHVPEDVWHSDLRKLTGGRPVALLWASPDCKHFSRAKGGKPANKNIRSLAWVAVKWASQVRPAVIVLENVREFEEWGPLVPLWECKECDWRGTEGQATLVRTRRRCPRCESLRLRQTADEVPDPSRKGMTFRLFVNRLRGCGYTVQWRNLNASDFGAPTHRRRLFLVARRDGLPIVWPEPTHGDPRKLDAQPLFARLKPWRTAAECIDWSLPCPSIFDRKRPLKPNTLRRVAMGIKRYVLDNPRPFIVSVNNGGWDNSPSRCYDPNDGPLTTITSKGKHGLVTPILVGVGGAEYAGKPRSPDEPAGTVLPNDRRSLVTPYLVRISQSGGNGGYTNAVDDPLTTVVSKAEHCLVCPTLAALAHGGNGTWGNSREHSVEQPLGTIHAGGGNALVAAFLAKHFGGVVGHGVDQPASTVTAVDHHSLVAAHLVRMNHDDAGVPVDSPTPTVVAGGQKLALVYSFLIRYFGTAIGQHCTEPLYTITGKDRFGLVTVTIDGEPYVIANIGMRMLAPRELATAQGFPKSYVLTGTKSNQVARIGNSVCPAVAQAIVAANVAQAAAEVA